MKTYSYLFLSFGLFGCATAVGDPVDLVGSGGEDALGTGAAPGTGGAPALGTGGTQPGATGGAPGTGGGPSGATGGGSSTATGGGTGTFDGPSVSFLESGAPGDVLLFDDFEMGAGSWYPNNEAPWSLAQDESQVLQQSYPVDDTMFVVGGSSNWSNVYVEARVKLLPNSGTDSDDIVAVAVRMKDLSNFYYVAIQGDGTMKLRKRTDGSNSSIGTTYNDANLVPNTWYTVGIEAIGTKLNMYLNGVLVQEEDDAEKYSADDSDLTVGYAGVGTLADAAAMFDDIRVVQK